MKAYGPCLWSFMQSQDTFDDKMSMNAIFEHTETLKPIFAEALLEMDELVEICRFRLKKFNENKNILESMTDFFLTEHRIPYGIILRDGSEEQIARLIQLSRDFRTFENKGMY